MGVYGYGFGYNLSKGRFELTPCLENAVFWQGLNLYDTNEVENKLEGESDIAIQNTSVMYFDGTSDGVATLTHEAIPTVTDVEVYFSSDNVTWSNTGAYNIVDDTLKIGYNGSFVAGYYGQVTIKKNTTDILQFTLAENNITENINRLNESVLDTLPPGGQLDLTFQLNFNRLAL